MSGISCLLSIFLLRDSCNVFVVLSVLFSLVSIVLLWLDMICFTFGIHL